MGQFRHVPGAGLGHGDRQFLPDQFGEMHAAVVAQREAELRAELSRHADSVAALDYMSEDITDLRGLLRLGAMMWRN